MTDTPILYRRTDTTPRNSVKYPELFDELMSSYISATDKIIFNSKEKLYEGFDYQTTNKVRSHTQINTIGLFSQKNTIYGLDSADTTINITLKKKADIDIFISLMESSPSSTYPNGIIGLYDPSSDFASIDPTSAKGYIAMGNSIKRRSQLNLWKITAPLRFGGTK